MLRGLCRSKGRVAVRRRRRTGRRARRRGRGGSGRSRGGAGWAACRRCGRPLRQVLPGVQHGAEFELGRHQQCLQPVRLVLPGHVDHDVAAVLHEDLGLADAGRVDALSDDVARHVEVGGVRLGAGERLRLHRDARATHQVEAELRVGLVVGGEEHEPVQHDDEANQYQEVRACLEHSGGCSHCGYSVSTGWWRVSGEGRRQSFLSAEDRGASVPSVGAVSGLARGGARLVGIRVGVRGVEIGAVDDVVIVFVAERRPTTSCRRRRPARPSRWRRGRSGRCTPGEISSVTESASESTIVPCRPPIVTIFVPSPRLFSMSWWAWRAACWRRRFGRSSTK